MKTGFYTMSDIGLTNSAVSEAVMVNTNTCGVGGHQHDQEPAAAPATAAAKSLHSPLSAGLAKCLLLMWGDQFR